MSFLCGLSILAADTPPPGGVSVLYPLEKLYKEGSDNTGAKVRYARARDLPGAPKAMEITTTTPKKVFYLTMEKGTRLRSGDKVLLHIKAKLVDTADESGQSQLDVTSFIRGLERVPKKKRASYDKMSGKVVVIAADKRWADFYLPVAITEDFPGKGVDLLFKMRGGGKRQTILLADVEILKYGPQTPFSSLPYSKIFYAGSASDAPWRAEAADRIKRYRTRPFAIRVLKGGAPVTGGRVEVDLERHLFQFGVAVRGRSLIPEFNKDHRVFRRLVGHFNALSFVNTLKWPPWENEWGKNCSRSIALDALKIVREMRIPLRGHCLVWPRKKSLSRKLVEMLDAPAPDQEKIKRFVLEHIEDELTKTAFWMEEWDVMNEAVSCRDIQKICGDEVMVDWFKQAKRLRPEIKAAINDYNILSSRHDSDRLIKQEKLLKWLFERGAPIDVIGMQTHVGALPPSPTRMKEVLDRFAKFGKPIRTTEFDMKKNEDPALKHDFTRDFITLMYSHPAVQGIQFWSMVPMLFDGKKGTPTALGKAYLELVEKKWRTMESGKTDAAGWFAARGHLGTYTLRVEIDGRSVERTFVLPKGRGIYKLTFNF
jgi:GH35 family endo-1,4-beta-xylanase